MRPQIAGQIIMNKIDLKNSLKVSEFFYSIQGEGPTAGHPAWFLRLTGCNLNCPWCDTTEVWRKGTRFLHSEIPPKFNHTSPDFLLGLEKGDHLIITGGEPMLQQDSIVQYLRWLGSLNPNLYVEVETNGTILPSENLISIIDQWNVSPKTSNSNNILEKCEIENCYRFFQKQSNTIFKFVVENPNDISEILPIVEKYELDKSKIILMPQASTKEDLLSCESLIKSLAQDNGFRYTSRLHIMNWGNTRGK